MVDSSYGRFDLGQFDVARFDYPLNKTTTKQLCITSDILTGFDLNSNIATYFGIESDITSAITINSTIKREC
jgi:hypothetical protein